MHAVQPHPDGLFLFQNNGGSEKVLLVPGERAFSVYSIVQRIILFQSGTSQMMLMVTSLWHHRTTLHPGGLVPNLPGPRCQFRGDWSEPIASLSSESVSNTLNTMPYHTVLSVLLRTWITSLRIHEYPWWNKSYMVAVLPGCVSFIFYFWLFVNPFSSPDNGYYEKRWSMANVGVHSYISTKTSSTSSELLCRLCSVLLWICWD